jgi:hypothetical protein
MIHASPCPFQQVQALVQRHRAAERKLVGRRRNDQFGMGRIRVEPLAVQALLIDGNVDQAQAAAGQRRDPGQVRGIFDDDFVFRVGQYMAGQQKPLRRSADHQDLLHGTGQAMGLAQIQGNLPAQIGQAQRAAIAQIGRGSGAPILRRHLGELVERQLIQGRHGGTEAIGAVAFRR